MTATPTPTHDPTALRARDPGLVVAPGDEGWDLARQAFNLTIDQRPAFVARPTSVEDVVAVVDHAREHGLRVAPQRTGHNAGPIESLAGAILLRTDALTGVDVYPEARMARVEGGAKWGAVSDATDPYGLTGLCGSARDVGVVGYHLGGGLSFVGRKHGLAANSVRAIELVSADGRVVRADRDRHADLFWALRGGGGSFGVVTAIEFDLYEVPQLYLGTLFFPFERAPEVLHAWHEWTLGMPDELMSVARLLQLPDLPEVPEVLRGQSFTTVQVVFLGSEADGAELVAPIRALGPDMDTLAMSSPAGLGYVAMDPEDPMPYLSQHAMVGELPAEAIDRLLEVAGPGSGSMLVTLELRHAGGALARSAPDHGAADTLPGSFVALALGAVMDETMVPPLEERLTTVRQALAPYEAGYYFNFTERPAEPGAFHPADAYRRLREVRGAWDPRGMFLANHPVT